MTIKNNKYLTFSLFTAIKKRWWLVLGTTALMAAVSLMMQWRAKPQYEATSFLALRTQTTPNPYVNQEMAAAYLNIDSVVNSAAKKMKDLSRNKISSSFHVVQVGGFVKIIAAAEKPGQAIKLSNVMGYALWEKASESGSNKIKNIKKRLLSLEKSQDNIDNELNNQKKKMQTILQDEATSSIEKNILSVWQTQLFSTQEEKTQRNSREQMDLRLQLENIEDTIPAFYPSTQPSFQQTPLKDRVLAGLISGMLLGMMISVWLELHSNQA
jgi:hypothetical protein